MGCVYLNLDHVSDCVSGYIPYIVCMTQELLKLLGTLMMALQHDRSGNVCQTG